MKYLTIRIWGVIVLVSLSLAAPAKADCPLSAQGETPSDCPWAGIARELLAEQAKAPAQPMLTTLRTEAPGLVAQWRQDRKLSAWKALWGKSVNFDENAKGVIVDPRILEAIAGEYRPPYGTANFNGREVLHAGMEHCYGYLFSLLETPFGYKRARWVRGELEAGFGLPAGTLSPAPPAGTLFSNVTYFVGRIAYRTDPKVLKTLEHDGHPSEALKKFDYRSLKTIRLEEIVQIPATPNSGASPGLDEPQEFTLRTDLVPFLHPLDSTLGSSDTYLLVYSILEPGEAQPKLVSAFPVSDSTVVQITAISTLGENQPIQLRYNAFVEGLYGVSLTGTRRLISEETGPP